MAGESTTKKRRKIRISHLLIAFLVAAIAAFILFRVSVKAKLQKKLDAIRAAGYPVTCTELNRWYTLPDNAENAAAYLTEAFSYYDKWDEQARESLPIVGQAQMPPRTQPLAEQTGNLIAAYLADNEQALRLLHGGAAIEHSRYPVDLTRGFAFLHHDLSELRQGAMLLRLEAILNAEDAQPDLSARSVSSMFGLAHSLSEEPVLISQLVRIACQALAVSTLEHVLNRIEFDDEQLLNLARTVADAQDLLAMSRAFAGERCFGIDLLTKPTRQKLTPLQDDIPYPLIQLYQALGLLDLDVLIYLELIEEGVEANRLPLHERQRAARDIESKLLNISDLRIFVRAFMPALSKATELDLRVIAQLRAAQVAVAIQRYRLAAGRLPGAIDDLVPTYLDAVPKDPFDGNYLRYKKLAPGFVVYSIGEDEIDNDGKERPEKTRKRENHDITFLVER